MVSHLEKGPLVAVAKVTGSSKLPVPVCVRQYCKSSYDSLDKCRKG